ASGRGTVGGSHGSARRWFVFGQVLLEVVAGGFDFRIERDLRVSCPITVAVLHEIRCDGVKPRRESLTGLELGAVLIDTHESFLRCIGSVFLVLQTTNEVMKQFLGVTPHEVMQRSVMAARE